jgi:hypothetical protein
MLLTMNNHANTGDEPIGSPWKEQITVEPPSMEVDVVYNLVLAKVPTAKEGAAAF